MKIIDLLNKIANGEEVPKKIRFDNTYWNRICGEKYPYYVNDNDSDLFIYFFRKNLTFSLNDEVEIIEEDNKIKKLKKKKVIDGSFEGHITYIYKYNEYEIGEKINEIINHINKE